MSKRSNSDPAMFILSKYIMPEDKDQRQMIEKMSAKSRVLLNRLAAKTAWTLLNFKKTEHSIKLGDLVYVVDHLTKQDPDTLRDAIGKLIGTAIGNHNFAIQLINQK